MMKPNPIPFHYAFHSLSSPSTLYTAMMFCLGWCAIPITSLSDTSTIWSTLPEVTLKQYSLLSSATA